MPYFYRFGLNCIYCDWKIVIASYGLRCSLGLKGGLFPVFDRKFGRSIERGSSIVDSAVEYTTIEEHTGDVAIRTFRNGFVEAATLFPSGIAQPTVVSSGTGVRAHRAESGRYRLGQSYASNRGFRISE